ncbi:2-dehydro-3-deoxygalactonokinase [Tropicimonas sp. IMCC34043]|uniref:2-dehydro-3-deoxygalactonokinase n=1 Tax=Tropicimonas sp. IMCC34043 TaxID=2248760 RepID=UPI001E59B994|nr:2-dehydro-3-deoxygalactonokinase [Tropicimonas sp. IMCC34043]
MTDKLIALDWGTSSLRAFLMDASGAVIETRARSDGIQALRNRGEAGFRETFSALCGDWIGQHGIRKAVACGMVGSAQGWQEAPYVACPADLGELAGNAVTIAAPHGVRLTIAPGLSFEAADGIPDVMRGEEIQIAGALAQTTAGTTLAILPGTHSKWVEVDGARILRFATYMTGELFAVLSAQSILGRLMEPASPDAAQSAEAFRKGLEIARDSRPGDLPHQLFAVRTLGLFKRMAPECLADCLSGILIGAEIVSARARWQTLLRPGARQPLLIGEGRLCARYAEALQVLAGVTPATLANTAPAGLFQLACAAGLIDKIASVRK